MLYLDVTSPALESGDKSPHSTAAAPQFCCIRHFSLAFAPTIMRNIQCLISASTAGEARYGVRRVLAALKRVTCHAQAKPSCFVWAGQVPPLRAAPGRRSPQRLRRITG